MAYGTPGEDKEGPPALEDEDLAKYFGDAAAIPFGVVPSLLLIPDATAEAINKAEFEAVEKRRAHYRIQTENGKGKNAIGLALSGGGIRSATFSLGVVQVLAERSLLKDVDFLSTVSGGGYTGSFLTTRLGDKQYGSANKPPEAVNRQSDAEDKRPESKNQNPHAAVAAPYGPDPVPVRYLRQHAKYLAALNLAHAWQMATATFAGMLLNWTAPLLLITAAALAVTLVVALLNWAAPLLPSFSSPQIPWLIALAGMAVLSTLTLAWYGRRLSVGRKEASSAGWTLAWMFAGTTAVAAGWLLTVIYGLLEDWKSGGSTLVWGGVVATLVTAAPTIIRFIPVLEKPAVRELVLKALLWLAGLIIPLGAIAVFYALLRLGLKFDGDLFGLKTLDGALLGLRFGALVLIGLVVVLFLVARLCLNVNLTGPHRLYRDQLARTFIQPDKESDTPAYLTAINPDASAPYHLINAAVNLPASTHAALRERKSDFFLFSRHYCGSPAIGYFPTEKWKVGDAPPDLATAMAVSGAAASSHMGLKSMPTLAALLTFLNLRLGFWIRHPNLESRYTSPGFALLLREMTGSGMSENHPWLNLSDGGHIENIGVYELLRRRCKFIICVDGEADSQYTFQGLMTLVRHAQIDFGIGIDVALNDLRLNPKTGYSQAHAVLCRIRDADPDSKTPVDPDQAPKAPSGLLLYLKLSLTGNEPELLRRYHLMRPEFPHQSTLDQFFSEEQFEAYRQLGVHVAESLFLTAVTGDNTEPKSVPEWFRSLAANLLQPKRA